MSHFLPKTVEQKKKEERIPLFCSKNTCLPNSAGFGHEFHPILGLIFQHPLAPGGLDFHLPLSLDMDHEMCNT